MNKDQRAQLAGVTHAVAGWVSRARTIIEHHDQVARLASEAVAALRRECCAIRLEGKTAWRVIPLTSSHSHLLGSIAQYHNLRKLSEFEEHLIRRQLIVEADQAIRDLQSVSGFRRFLHSSSKREASRKAADFLNEFYRWAVANNVAYQLESLTPKSNAVPAVPTADALADWVGLSGQLQDIGVAPQLLAASSVASLAATISTIQTAGQRTQALRGNAVNAGNNVRQAETRRLVAEMPVDRLREATRERLQIAPLDKAGIKTVLQVREQGRLIEHIPGLGSMSATRILGAAETLWKTTLDETPARIDLKTRPTEATQLLRALAAWDGMRRGAPTSLEIATANALIPLGRTTNAQTSHLLVFPTSPHTVAAFDDLLVGLGRRARELNTTDALTGTGSGGKAVGDPWHDFQSRPADYFALLSELGFLTEDERKTRGDLPEVIVESIRKFELNIEYLLASLRGYQSFGARFALVQRKVIIGDEMGLGKTIEALAVLAHLRATGNHHTVVVCPAAVVTNWVREIASKSRLRPHRVHGAGRESAARSWINPGGVAVTTYETLAWFDSRLAEVGKIGCVVVDEAHYIKNPAAKRSQRTSTLISNADRAILLTGTPLENRLEEFRYLVGYVRPELVVDADEFTPARFRKQVAPAYLRRNQEDVLVELPDLVEVNEWVPISDEDSVTYRAAVTAGNFMAMRQAAMSRHGSGKVQRLIEIVREAEENNRRVLVFSHFRAVLDLVMAALPGKVYGPLTGSVPAQARQTMVDQFQKAEHGSVLVAQIVAGGVGLNIQAASVVVICEPQLKPTIEWQAIARAHRMGQLESVQVHRLLSEEGVDVRITEILAHKRAMFEEFAKRSETAGSAPEAYDVSEADLTRDVIASERERLFSAGAKV
ncbi:DEAD/DEAH box helicase [Nocardia ignorata]|uniref:DEAD/DEAH box helicase n=1 Tax=Nocardia ignorata TaxID=145285 RepID=UPI003628CD34